MRTRPIQNNFRAGVLSPNMKGLVGTDIYSSGLEVGRNITIETMGGIKRRSGTEFVTNYGNVEYMRIFPFTFNRDQAYVIAIILADDSTSRMDIYRDNVLVAPDIIIPYGTATEIEELDFAQSADSMIFTQGDNEVYYLKRLGTDASWSFIPVPITNPPQYNDTPENMWTAELGYPQHCTFHQGRLWFAGSRSFPQNVWASVSQDFFNFDLGTQQANESIQEALDTDFINPITSIFSARQLQVFTRGGEFSNPATVITPDTSYWVRQSDYGSAYFVPPVAVDGATLFVDSSGRTIRNFIYSDERSGYDAPSISSHAEHLVKEPQRMGVLRGDALEPANFVFVINVDGTMALLNVSKAHDLLAWTEWVTQGLYRDIITLDREVYILVERYLTSSGEYVTYNGEDVTHNGELVYINGDPNDNVRLEWVLERVNDVMLVDSGKLQSNISTTSTTNINKGVDDFFGIYYDESGIKGRVVIVRDGAVIFKADYLRDDPKRPFINVDGVAYSSGNTFSYNESIREQYFDEEVGFQWYMYVLFNVMTIDSGKNFIDGLAHLIGLECVSSLDGNIQDPQVVVAGEIVETVEKTYPDGNDWLYTDDVNVVIKTYVDGILAQTECIYDSVSYINPSLTEYGYLISGVVAEPNSSYLEEGVVVSSVIVDYDTETFDVDGTFTPLLTETTVGICMVGGGGGGNNGGSTFIPGGGGEAGEVISNSAVTVVPEENVAVVVGTGGAGTNTTDGGDGSLSSFGTLVADGGEGAEIFVGYFGNGAEQTSCGGTANDGVAYGSPLTVAYGGESSGFGNGGNGGRDAGGVGGIGSGGGGVDARLLANKGGNGGVGRVIVTHSIDSIQTTKANIRKSTLISATTAGGVLVYPDTTFNVGQTGLFFSVVAKTMPINVSAGGGSLVNEPKRIVSVTSRFKDTQGVIVNGIEIPERVLGDEVLDISPPLLTGIEKNRHLGYNRETAVTISQKDPMPFTLLSIDVEVNF